MIKQKTRNFGIIEAIRELKEISLTDRLRYEYEMRLKEKRDREAMDGYVYEQGLQQGMEKGLQSFINSFRRNGHTDEQIITELMTEFGLSRGEAEEKLEKCR